MSKLKAYKKEIAKSSKVTKTANAKRPRVKNEQQLTNDPATKPLPNHGSDGYNFLASILHATIFFDYFEYVATKSYKGKSIEIKIITLKTAHPKFHTICLFFDFITRLFALLALSVFAVWSVYKVTVK